LNPGKICFAIDKESNPYFVWQPKSKERLTYQDAVEIIDNTVGFYGTLLRWGAETAAKKNKSVYC